MFNTLRQSCIRPSDAPLIWLFTDMITSRTSRLDMNVDPPLFGDMFEHGLTHGRTADIPETDNECGWCHWCDLEISGAQMVVATVLSVTSGDLDELGRAGMRERAVCNSSSQALGIAIY